MSSTRRTRRARSSGRRGPVDARAGASARARGWRGRGFRRAQRDARDGRGRLARGGASVRRGSSRGRRASAFGRASSTRTRPIGPRPTVVLSDALWRRRYGADVAGGTDDRLERTQLRWWRDAPGSRSRSARSSGCVPRGPGRPAGDRFVSTLGLLPRRHAAASSGGWHRSPPTCAAPPGDERRHRFRALRSRMRSGRHRHGDGRHAGGGDGVLLVACANLRACCSPVGRAAPRDRGEGGARRVPRGARARAAGRGAAGLARGLGRRLLLASVSVPRLVASSHAAAVLDALRRRRRGVRVLPAPHRW